MDYLFYFLQLILVVIANHRVSRVGRAQVNKRKFLSLGNAQGQSYTEWLFESATELEFRRSLRVSKQVFAYLLTRQCAFDFIFCTIRNDLRIFAAIGF